MDLVVTIDNSTAHLAHWTFLFVFCCPSRQTGVGSKRARKALGILLCASFGGRKSATDAGCVGLRADGVADANRTLFQNLGTQASAMA